MSAADTALRVVRWALAGEAGGPPPRGDLLATDELLHPPAELRSALAELAATAAARLRLGDPPVDAKGGPGLDGLVLAVAIAHADAPALAGALLGGMPRTRNPWEWVVRHALTAPALPYVHPVLADQLRARSPLTALFERPPGRQDASAVAAAERLRRHPAGRLALQLRLARPTGDPAIRAWRTRLLERLRLDETGRGFVLDVFEAAMVHHQQEHLAQSRQALGVFFDPVAARDDARLEDALATADWWGPLRALEVTDIDALRARRYLGYAYREGIKVHRIGRRMRGR